MPTAVDFPNSAADGTEFVASGKSWTYLTNSWRRYTTILTDGGYADTTYNITDDGGSASGL